MYLIDTNVVSEIRKTDKADRGVRDFFARIRKEGVPAYLSVVTVGELRRGVELIRHRGDLLQAHRLEMWLETILDEHADHLIAFDDVCAQVWGRLRVPNHEHALDKQIAASALVHGLVVVTRNVEDFAGTGVEVLNPFTGER